MDLALLNLLPEEIVDMIKHYIPVQCLLLLSKTHYVTVHSLLRRFIKPINIEKYIRSTVKRDHCFVFKKILRENYERWFNIKEYRYKNQLFSNYIYFIKAFCIENESINCYEVLNLFLEELGLGKNLHKKNISRNIIYYH